MNRAQKALTCVYATLYAAGLLVVYLDVFEWRVEPPPPSGAQIQAAEQAKAFFK